MAYSRTTWVDGSAPAIDADHLNNIEVGVEDAHKMKWHVVTQSEYGAKGDGTADDAPAIQAALDAVAAAGGGTVYVPAGRYRINTALIIKSFTHLLLSNGATIIRNAEIDNMIRNGDTAVNGYNGEHDIVIQGGAWDANGDSLTSPCTVMALGHGRNIVVRDLVIHDVPQYHHIEVGGCRDVLIDNCNFLTWLSNGGAIREMVQIDGIFTSGTWLWFGNFDGTPCYNIRIERCNFINGSEGIGTHNAAVGTVQRRIKIIDCYFQDLSGFAISALNYGNLTVRGCSFENVDVGVYLETLDTILNGFSICDNDFNNLHRTSNSRAIWIQGESGATINRGEIRGNWVENIGRHAIGLEHANKWTVADNDVNNVGNDALYSNGVGIYAVTCNNIEYTDNVVFNCGAADMRVQNDCRDVSVIGNKMGRLEVFAGSDHVTISGNNADAIELTSADDVSISNNIIMGAISASGSRRLIVMGNRADTLTIAEDVSGVNSYASGNIIDTAMNVGPVAQAANNWVAGSYQP